MDLVKADRESFGGVYFGEHDGNWGLTVQFVGPNTRRDDIERVAPIDAPLAWEQVALSRSQLDRIQSEIADRIGELKLSYVELDTINNRIIVAVRDGSPDDVAGELSTYGSAVHVLDQTIDERGLACVDRDNCTPWRAGIYVYKSGTPADHDLPDADGCSWGWIGRHTSSGSLVMITAGHCYTVVSWNHSTDPYKFIGTTSYNALDCCVGYPEDVARVTGNSMPEQRNRLYRNESSKNQALTGIQQNNSIAVGHTIRQTGVTTGSTLGSITSVSVYYTLSNNPYDPSDVLWGMKHNAWVEPGDSGGPVWSLSSQTLYGIHSGSTGTFVPAQTAQYSLSVTMCITDACPWP